MEKLIRIPMLILTLLLASCEYLGFDGYINQLGEIGINHELADAVSLGQHLVSRPREFNGRVYVLGTRGVYVLRASKLSSYQYYPYSQDLGYERDFWEDRLPPINCYRDPVSGRVVVNAVTFYNDRGIKPGDTLIIDEDTGTALYDPPASTGNLFIGPITSGGSMNYVMTYWNGEITGDVFWNSVEDSPPGSGTQARSYTDPELIFTRSISLTPAGTGIRLVTQIGTSFGGSSPAQLQVYEFDAADDWSTDVSIGGVYVNEAVRHDYIWTSYFSGNLNVSVNNRYMLIWGEDLEDEETMLIYDYLTGERRLKVDIPGNETIPELAESGMDVFVTSIRGGVARYDYD